MTVARDQSNFRLQQAEKEIQVLRRQQDKLNAKLKKISHIFNDLKYVIDEDNDSGYHRSTTHAPEPSADHSRTLNGAAEHTPPNQASTNNIGTTQANSSKEATGVDSIVVSTPSSTTLNGNAHPGTLTPATHTQSAPSVIIPDLLRVCCSE